MLVQMGGMQRNHLKGQVRLRSTLVMPNQYTISASKNLCLQTICIAL